MAGKKNRTEDEIAADFAGVMGAEPQPIADTPAGDSGIGHYEKGSLPAIDVGGFETPAPVLQAEPVAAAAAGADQLAVIDRITATLDKLVNLQASGGANEVVLAMMAQLTQAMNRMAEAQIAGAKMITDESRRAHRPSNEVVHLRSVLNPRGERDFPKPKLRCQTFIPWELDQDSCTREEIELANLLETGEYVVRLTNGMKVKMQCHVTYGLDEVTPSRVMLKHDTAFKNDNKDWVPPLDTMLRQILSQSKNPETKKKAAAVLTMDEENALIAAGELQTAA